MQATTPLPPPAAVRSVTAWSRRAAITISSPVAGGSRAWPRAPDRWPVVARTKRLWRTPPSGASSSGLPPAGERREQGLTGAHAASWARGCTQSSAHMDRSVRWVELKTTARAGLLVGRSAPPFARGRVNRRQPPSEHRFGLVGGPVRIRQPPQAALAPLTGNRSAHPPSLPPARPYAGRIEFLMESRPLPSWES